MTRCLAPLVGPIDFAHVDGPRLVRNRGWAQDIVFWDPLHFRKDALTAGIGIHLPLLALMFSDVGLPGPFLTVSRHLGSRRPDASDLQAVYDFGPPRSLVQAAAELAVDIREVAVPWFDSFPDLSTLARGYFETEVERRVAANAPRPNPMPLLVYALLLRQLGREGDSREWSERVLAELRARGGGSVTKPDEPLALLVQG